MLQRFSVLRGQGCAHLADGGCRRGSRRMRRGLGAVNSPRERADALVLSATAREPGVGPDVFHEPPWIKGPSAVTLTYRIADPLHELRSLALQTKDGGYLPALSGLAGVGVALAMAAAFF